MKVYYVRWTDDNGRTVTRGFNIREAAIRFLNHLILDLSYGDAKLISRRVSLEVGK